MESTNAPKVTDKRRKYHVDSEGDPVDRLVRKTLDYVMNQPEFYRLLQLPKPARKLIANRIAKTITNFPRFQKVILQELTEKNEEADRS